MTTAGGVTFEGARGPKSQAACFGITSPLDHGPIDAVEVDSDSGMLSQYCAEVPKSRPSRAAVSAVMLRFSFTIRLMAVRRHADRLG